MKLYVVYYNDYGGDAMQVFFANDLTSLKEYIIDHECATFALDDDNDFSIDTDIYEYEIAEGAGRMKCVV